MIRPRVIVCLSLIDHDLVKTKKFNEPRYLGDPVNAVKIFNDKAADELSILDITASKQKRGPDFDYLKNIASEAFMPLSYGGGITSIDEIKKLFRIGYEKVIINTSFFTEPDLITKAANLAGSQSIVVSIDVNEELFGKKICYYGDGKLRSKLSPLQAVKKAEELGAGEIIINSIQRDGVMKGYDLDMIAELSKAVNVPVIACGGAGNVNDLKSALKAGASAVAAGSMFVFWGAEKAVLIHMPDENEMKSLYNNI